LGKVVLGAGFFKRLSSFGRIATGVPVVLVLGAFGYALIWLGQKIINYL
jgi:hypothetical protein